MSDQQQDQSRRITGWCPVHETAVACPCHDKVTEANLGRIVGMGKWKCENGHIEVTYPNALARPRSICARCGETLMWLQSGIYIPMEGGSL